jgi:hypothetical protein
MTPKKSHENQPLKVAVVSGAVRTASGAGLFAISPPADSRF